VGTERDYDRIESEIRDHLGWHRLYTFRAYMSGGAIAVGLIYGVFAWGWLGLALAAIGMASTLTVPKNWRVGSHECDRCYELGIYLDRRS